MTDDVVARKVGVRGRVQGVFFRDSCSREAQLAGVTGWVRNEPDGSVAAHFEGPAAAVEHMVAWCHEGPPHARVVEVLATETSPTGAADFDVRM